MVLSDEAILNIISYFIPSETVFDERDPPWLNKNIKDINYKHSF